MIKDVNATRSSSKKSFFEQLSNVPGIAIDKIFNISHLV